MNAIQPLVTIDVPQRTLPAVRPTMPAGKLKISTIEQYAPSLARELLDTFDFSPSVAKGKPASLSVAKAYSQVTTTQYRMLAKIGEFRDLDATWTKGVLGTLAAGAAGVAAAFFGVTGSHDLALGIISALAGGGALFVGCTTAEGITATGNQLPAELAKIAAEPPLLPAAKSD